MNIMAIYQIRSKATGKIYVGSAMKYVYRISVHLCRLKKGLHHSKILQNHFNKYGIEDLEFNILEEIFNSEDLIIREQFYIDTLKPVFNIRMIAHNQLGVKKSEETRRKISESKRGVSIKGHPISEETKLKLKIFNTGKVLSLEHRRKMSESRKGLKRPRKNG